MITITNKLLIEEAEKVGVKYKIVSERHNLVVFSFQDEEALVRRSRIPNTSGVFSYIADNKGATYDLLSFYNYSIPQTKTVSSFEEAKVFVKEIGYPAVIKPEGGAYGNGVTANIKNDEDFAKAYLFAEECNPKEVIVQTYIPGDDYRIMVVGFKVVAVAKRIPARVFGDGEKTIRELIDLENQNPLRKKGHTSPLTVINLNQGGKDYLKEQGFDFDSVLEKELEVRLLRNANLSTGGEAEDLTDQIPQENIQLFEEIAKALHANLVGIDIRADDISKPLSSKDYAVIEVNASPGIRMHHYPSKGKPQNIAKVIMKQLFPKAFI